MFIFFMGMVAGMLGIIYICYKEMEVQEESASMEKFMLHFRIIILPRQSFPDRH